jgi:hypothetical protein
VIQLTDLVPKQAKDVGLYRAQPVNAVMDRAVPGEADAMHPVAPVAHPPHGRTRSRLGALVGDGLVVACPWLTPATWRHSIPAPGSGHHQQQAWHAAGRVATHRGAEAQRVVEHANAALGRGLTCRGREHRWSAQRRCRKRGSAHQPGVVWRVVRHLGVIRPPRGWPRPVHGGEGDGGRRPPRPGLMLVVDEAVGFHLRVGPPCRQRSASRLCRRRWCQAWGWPVQAWGVDGGICARRGWADPGCGTLQGRC